jgi:hypothetical protein
MRHLVSTFWGIDEVLLKNKEWCWDDKLLTQYNNQVLF